MKIPFDQFNNIYITSDTHGYHKNITRGVSEWGPDRTGDGMKVRDFDTVAEMNQKMIDNINTMVPKDGILFHLGDWSFGGKDKIELFRSSIICENIHLVTGNHDEHIEKGTFDHLFSSRQKYLELFVGSMVFCLFHFRISSWNHISRGSYHLHGHQHWQGDKRFSEGKCMDVGVDGNNLTPYHLPSVVNMLKDRKKVDEFDHHTL